MKKMKILLAIIVVGLLLTTTITAQVTGQQVMEQVYSRDSGNNMSANLSMTITNARGSTRERSIVQFRQDDGAVENKIMFFTAPADVRNTSFLSYSYADGRKDDQWIYLPALSRVKRIASDKTKDSFMGSDFTYDDMGVRHPSADTHSLLREEVIDGWNCYVVESVPVDASSDFAKTISWIIKDEWIGLKKEFYAAKGNVVRRLVIDEYEKIDDIWVITNMTMSNLEKNTSTRITMNNVSFNNNLSANFFTERQMKMGPRI